MIRAVDTLKERLGTLRPEVAIVLGSSLGPVADAVTAPLRIPYRDLPGFPVPKISGHSGEVLVGRLNGKPVLVLRGRGHPYEKGDAAVMPSFELLRYESGPPLTTSGRLILMGLVALFVLAGLGLFLPLGLKMTVVYLLVAGIPAAFVMRLIWTRQR